MKTNLQKTPKATNVVKERKGNENLDDNTNKSSDGASFTIVTYGRKPRATSKLQFTEVTKTKFQAFQRIIFPIVEKILDENKTLDTHFACQWKALCVNNKVDATTSYRSAQKAIKFNQLPEYRTLLEALPGIQNYIIFRNDRLNPDGFYYALPDSTQEPLVISEEQKKASSNNHNKDKLEELEQYDDTKDNETIASVPNTKKYCYGTDLDIKTMFTDLWPYIQDYRDRHPTSSHSKQWLAWMERGLSSKSPLTQVKAIMRIDTVAQLYLTLRDFPAVNVHYDIKWDHKIEYQLKPMETDTVQIKEEKTDTGHIKNDDGIKTQIKNDAMQLNPTYKVRAVSNQDEEFKVFHKLIYDEISQWASKPETHQHPLRMQWTKLTFAGLQPIMQAP
jgi:hypothetical protein